MWFGAQIQCLPHDGAGSSYLGTVESLSSPFLSTSFPQPRVLDVQVFLWGWTRRPFKPVRLKWLLRFLSCSRPRGCEGVPGRGGLALRPLLGPPGPLLPVRGWWVDRSGRLPDHLLTWRGGGRLGAPCRRLAPHEWTPLRAPEEAQAWVCP